MRTTTRSALFTLVTLTTAAAAGAQTSTPMAIQRGTQTGAQPAMPVVKEATPGLLRQATIAADAATRTAMQQVANGQIQEAEIEQEHGRLVYSYDIKALGKSGIDEVLVDAKTGAVVSHTHESPAAEAAEARADARAAHKTHAAKRTTGTEPGKQGEKPDSR